MHDRVVIFSLLACILASVDTLSWALGENTGIKVNGNVETLNLRTCMSSKTKNNDNIDRVASRRNDNLG